MYILHLFWWIWCKKVLNLLTFSSKQKLLCLGTGIIFNRILFKSHLSQSLLFFKRFEKSEILRITHSCRVAFDPSSIYGFLGYTIKYLWKTSVIKPKVKSSGAFTHYTSKLKIMQDHIHAFVIVKSFENFTKSTLFNSEFSDTYCSFYAFVYSEAKVLKGNLYSSCSLNTAVCTTPDGIPKTL